MAISEKKRSGVESYPYPVKEGQRYINLNSGRRLFVQQPPKREREREAGSFKLLRQHLQQGKTTITPQD